MKKYNCILLLILLNLFCNAQNWTWMKGQKTIFTYGNYGVMGVPAPPNEPGSRHGAATWVDPTGNLWYFGGEGIATAGPGGWLNDLWKYDIATNEWVWIHGANVIDQAGIYGTKGVASSTNCPGAREFASYWTDASGNFWLFGGDGFDGSGNYGNLNDLWKYNPTTNQWTWISGTNLFDQTGIYGSITVPSAANVPGGRYSSACWIDAANNLWLFGGFGFPAAGTNGKLNDLWRYNTTTNQWTWMKGATVIDQSGVYNLLGVAMPPNVPGAREFPLASISSTGDAYIFGGNGFPETGPQGYLNDVWKYDSGTNMFTWMTGSKTPNQLGLYGPSSVSSPTNTPGARYAGARWADKSGNFWIFGGMGYASSGGVGRLNDLWKYNPSSNEWAFYKGNQVVNQFGVYGTQGVTALNNRPGARYYPNSWTDLKGNLWLQAGFGFDNGSGLSNMNDLWVFELNCSPTNNTTADNLNLCSGNSSTLSATSTSSVTINWYTSLTSTTSVGSGNTYVTPSYTASGSPATYTLYTEVSTCTLTPVRSAITVTVYPLPTLTVTSSNTLLCLGQSATISVNGASSYTWSTSSTNFSISVSPTITTNYTVTGTDANSCDNNSVFTQSVSACTGINELSLENGFEIFPNPTKDILYLRSNLTATIEFYNVFGELVESLELNSGNKMSIDIGSLASGIYFIRSKQDPGRTFKLVKQ